MIGQGEPWSQGTAARPAPRVSLPRSHSTTSTVAFRLADTATYTAVERASLSVAAGEFVSIVGPTGCGKSTLLNVAAGLLAPTAGTVSILGTPLTGLNRAAGYLFQSDALFPLEDRARECRHRCRSRRHAEGGGP